MSCIRHIIPALILCSATLPQQAEAQISFTVNRQNGIVTGGGFQVNGMVTHGGRYVRMGINANASQLIGVQNYNLLNGATTMASTPMAMTAVSTRQEIPARPSAGLFAKTAWRFDRNKDRELDEGELTTIAAAVIKELRPKTAPVVAANSAKAVTAAATVPPATESVEAFVTHCLTFDKNDDKTLNESETKRMAAAFIRSLK